MRQRRRWNRMPPPFGPRWLRNWQVRHQHPACFALHVIGMPMTAAAVVIAFQGRYGLALGLFVLGYLLQFLGHAIEGNDTGELIPIKRLLGRPYIVVSQRWQTEASAEEKVVEAEEVAP